MTYDNYKGKDILSPKAERLSQLKYNLNKKNNLMNMTKNFQNYGKKNITNYQITIL